MDPSDRAKAVCELVALGENAIPILKGILDGTSTNQFGIPYSKLGQPISCALVVVQRLGTIAKPLESFIDTNHPYGPDALLALSRDGALNDG